MYHETRPCTKTMVNECPICGCSFDSPLEAFKTSKTERVFKCPACELTWGVPIPRPYRALSYCLRSAITRRHIRMATMVIFTDGYQVRFMDRMPRYQAFKQAIAYREREGV